MEQQQEEAEHVNILSGKVLGFGYNTIHIRESGSKGRERSIYFDGLQKRVLSGIDDDVMKRLKFIEFTDTEDWNVGINLFACCDKCGCALFSVCSNDDFYDKHECPKCERWLCSDCVKVNGLCNSCMKKEMLINLQ
jgi:hypothetical protein